MQIQQSSLDRVLLALSDQLAARDAQVELVVIGGSALLALGLVSRSTTDIDVVAIASGESFRSARPFPPELEQAQQKVGRDFGLRDNWLNPGPTDLLQFGLPEGFWARIETRSYGKALIVHFAGRLDQIHFKLFAVADQGPGRHEADLRALKPTHDELTIAAKWAVTQDPSPGFLMVLRSALRSFGVDDDLGT